MYKLFLLFFGLIFNFQAKGLGIFSAESQDPYKLASFSTELELEKLLSNAAHALFLESFEKEFGAHFDTPKNYEILKTTNVDDWEMMLFEQRNKQVAFLKNYEKRTELSADFAELVTTNIRFNYWHLLLAYSINRSNENTGLKMVTSLPRIMTEGLDLSKTNNDKWLISKSYREFIPYFVVYFNSAEKHFKKYTDASKGLTDKAKYAEHHLKGNVLDYALTQLIAQSNSNLSTGSFRFWSSQIYCEKLQNYLQSSFFEQITTAEKKREEEGNKLAELKKTNLPIITDLEGLPFTFEKYKGKVIYVDFWASWCGPCRAMFPFSKKLHESLSESQKKEIVFLYISIDEDLQKWKEAVEKLGLKESGINGHSLDVSSKYMVASIPRYMILDKKGDVIHPNAPRPSSQETRDLLIEILDK